MQDIRLYINDQLVDLPPDIARQLRLSKGGTDAAELGAHTADQSYTLTLPATRTNEALFRNADPQSTGKFFSPSPYRARLEVGGRPLLTGSWRLSGILNGYQGLLLAEEVDVFALLGQRTLRQITTFAPVTFRGGHDFAGLLTKSNTESDLCFPLVAYGNFFAPAQEGGPDLVPTTQITAPLELDDYTPSVYYVNIIRHIFESAGWKAGGEPLDDPFFRELCLPHTGEEYGWNWSELLRVEAAPGEVTDTWQSISPEEETDSRFHGFFPLSLPAAYNPAARWRNSAYTVRRAGGYHLKLELEAGDFLWSYGAVWSGVWVELRRVPAGSDYLSGDVLGSQAIGGAGTYAGGVVSLQTFNPVFLDETDRVVVVVHITTDDGQMGTARLDYQVSAFTVTPAEVEIIGPLAIDVAANLPELNQRDFVKGFMTLGNLRFALDVRNRQITFYYHERYELPADFAVDLTGAADPELSEFVPATTARRFLFQYTEDGGDALGPQARALSDKIIDTRNFNASGDQPLTLPFAATAMRDYWQGGRVHQLPCMASQEQFDAPLNTVSWAYGYTPRLIRYTGPSLDTLPLAFMGGSSVYGTGNTAGLTWAELYERHYRGYVTDIVKGHLLKNRFALTPDLYRQLSPARPVLFHGILYRLNKVQGYAVADPGALTEVELLRRVQEAAGGGRPKDSQTPLTQEWYGEEFYPGEFY